MELEKRNKLTCPVCEMELSSVFCKNRHVRTKHPEVDSGSTAEQQAKRTRHIICPICTSDTSFSFYNDLTKHLATLHDITVKESSLNFRDFKEFTVWRVQENRDVGYACRTRKKYPNGKEQNIYDCNRSNSRGFVSSAKERRAKVGGSIRIHGTCPSRIVANISINGSVTINCVETHVGHSDEPKTKEISKIKLSTSPLHYQDVDDIQEAKPHIESITFEDKREIVLQEIVSYARNLDEETFNNFVMTFRKFKSDTGQNAESIPKKIKMEKETC